MRFTGLLLCFASVSLAGEFAVLSTGGRLHIDRHESNGATVRLYTGSSVAEISADKVASFEPEDYTPPPTPPTPAPAVEAAPAPPPTPAPTPADLADRAADKYGLPHWLVRSVMKVE